MNMYGKRKNFRLHCGGIAVGRCDDDDMSRIGCEDLSEGDVGTTFDSFSSYPGECLSSRFARTGLTTCRDHLRQPPTSLTLLRSLVLLSPNTTPLNESVLACPFVSGDLYHTARLQEIKQTIRELDCREQPVVFSRFNRSSTGAGR